MKKAGIFGLARKASQSGIRILCYHGVWQGSERFAGDSMFILEGTFESRLALLRRLNFNIISLNEAVAGLRGERRVPPDCVVITIDDGWYSTYAHMVPALMRHDMHATIYCDTKNLLSNLPIPHVMARYLRKLYAPNAGLSAKAENAFARATDLRLDAQLRYSAALEFADSLQVDSSSYVTRRAFSYMTEDELMQTSRDGFAIELHTHSHSLADFSFAKVREEISMNREVLGRLLNVPPSHFRHLCYPSGIGPPNGDEPPFRHLGIASATTTRPGIAYPGVDLMLLPRILDGDQLSELEFEAEVCGVGDFLRKTRALGSNILARGRHQFAGDHRTGMSR
jgi:peptidoglycan/xylan/chitin deacetylase (PgdA/CDA1 family)